MAQPLLSTHAPSHSTTCETCTCVMPQIHCCRSLYGDQMCPINWVSPDFHALVPVHILYQGRAQREAAKLLMSFNITFRNSLYAFCHLAYCVCTEELFADDLR